MSLAVLGPGQLKQVRLGIRELSGFERERIQKLLKRHADNRVSRYALLSDFAAPVQYTSKFLGSVA
jgi:hypothetical protein